MARFFKHLKTGGLFGVSMLCGERLTDDMEYLTCGKVYETCDAGIKEK
jgi:hypothetical protein